MGGWWENACVLTEVLRGAVYNQTKKRFEGVRLIAEIIFDEAAAAAAVVVG